MAACGTDERCACESASTKLAQGFHRHRGQQPVQALVQDKACHIGTQLPLIRYKKNTINTRWWTYARGKCRRRCRPICQVVCLLAFLSFCRVFVAAKESPFNLAHNNLPSKAEFLEHDCLKELDRLPRVQKAAKDPARHFAATHKQRSLNFTGDFHSLLLKGPQPPSSSRRMVSQHATSVCGVSASHERLCAPVRPSPQSPAPCAQCPQPPGWRPSRRAPVAGSPQPTGSACASSRRPAPPQKQPSVRLCPLLP